MMEHSAGALDRAQHWLAQALMYGFVGARALHALAYATKQSHEVRATFYTVGPLIVIFMAGYVLWRVAG